MTRVQATCTACQEIVELDADELHVDLLGDQADAARVAFACPHCAADVLLVVKPSVARMLLEDPDRPDLGARLRHPSAGVRRSVPSGPVFTHDDLLDFHELLHQPGWFDQLLAATNDHHQAV